MPIPVNLLFTIPLFCRCRRPIFVNIVNIVNLQVSEQDAGVQGSLC